MLRIAILALRRLSLFPGPLGSYSTASCNFQLLSLKSLLTRCKALEAPRPSRQQEPW